MRVPIRRVEKPAIGGCHGRLGVLLIALGWAGACSPVPVPAKPEAPPAAEAPAEAPTGTEAPTTPVERREGSVVVIDPGTDTEEQPKSLAEIAQAERARKAQAGKPVAVITNKTLPKHADKGKVSTVQPEPPTAAPATAPPSEPVRDEQYWRSRGREIRERWRQAVEETERLQQNVTDLRRRFYAEADPHRRDGQIKPEWDRSLERLEQARTEAEVTRLELETFLEEGRKAGALPGWLREGAEDEPKPEVLPPPATESSEPREYREEPPR